MRIYVQGGLKGRHELDVDSHYTIGQVRGMLIERGENEEDAWPLVYGGKPMLHKRSLADYNIGNEATIKQSHPIIKVSGSPILFGVNKPTQPGTLPAAAPSPPPTVFSDRPSKNLPKASKAFKEWKKLADEYGFDADFHAADPETHYSLLEALEHKIIQNSEFLRSHGPAKHAIRPKDYADDLLQSSPTITGCPIPRVSIKSGWGGMATGDRALVMSRFALARILESFQLLADHGLATTYFSLLVDRGNAVAEIVSVPRRMLEELAYTLDWCLHDPAHIHDLGLAIRRLRNVFGHDFVLFGAEKEFVRGVSVGYDETGYRDTALDCRGLVQLLDLGIVLYTGSHAGPFLDNMSLGLSFKGPGLRIAFGNAGHPQVLCCRRRLACLDGFLQEQEVWVFHSGRGAPRKTAIGVNDDDEQRPISLLTTIDKFADLWGPVFAVKTTGNEEGGILQYNAGNGVIRPLANGGVRDGFKGAVACHWAAEPGHFLRRISHSVWNFLDPFPKVVMKKDDVLLIGHIMECNEDGCGYSLGEFKRDHSERISPFGTAPSAWQWDTRNISLGISKLVGITIAATQKRTPARTLKEAIKQIWNDPCRANPVSLKQYLGVEMSHCTGNARRVTLGRLLYSRALREYLDMLFPCSEGKNEWAPKLRQVLESDNIHDLWGFWKENMKKRGEIGELVNKLLEFLDSTGSDGVNFRATMFHNHQLYTVGFPAKVNTWTSHLRDSHLSAAYVFMPGKCLTSSKPSGECRQIIREAAFTHLQTQLLDLDDCAGTYIPVASKRGGTERLAFNTQICDGPEGGSSACLIPDSWALGRKGTQFCTENRDCWLDIESGQGAAEPRSCKTPASFMPSWRPAAPEDQVLQIQRPPSPVAAVAVHLPEKNHVNEQQQQQSGVEPSETMTEVLSAPRALSSSSPFKHERMEQGQQNQQNQQQQQTQQTSQDQQTTWNFRGLEEQEDASSRNSSSSSSNSSQTNGSESSERLDGSVSLSEAPPPNEPQSSSRQEEVSCLNHVSAENERAGVEREINNDNKKNA
ncbi:hypothetical protein QBC42DRAFT_332879 [Cladorrhinum samala]|uniref:Ubiquitin-like domain-containing protein n=1 Tax=Cladorrhinum samala TaxID=585594 RepID=A0AAV9HK57_9PEZI|nr:hypothetical protein QBC42DRAFT_332879 [Cladorrhinum samala]